MKTTTICPVCGITFTRFHTADEPPKTCSHACAMKSPGRMTEAIRLKIGRPSPNNKGGSISRSRSGKLYRDVYIRLADRPLHPTVHRSGTIRHTHYVWNLAHPDDPVLKGEVIHHLDEDSLNDALENLEKLHGQSVHASMHMLGHPKPPRSEAHKLNLSIARGRRPDRDCEQCGKALTRSQINEGGRFCGQVCHFAFRNGKPKTGY